LAAERIRVDGSNGQSGVLCKIGGFNTRDSEIIEPGLSILGLDSWAASVYWV